MATSRGEPERWGTEPESSDPVTCSGHDTQPCGHPVCFTEQRTGLTTCSAALFLSHRQAPPPLIHTHTHTHTHTHRLTHSPHIHSLTQPHTQLTHSSLTLTHPHILLTHLNTCILLTHSTNTYTLHTHIHPHTYIPSHTHTHTFFIPSHTHTLTHSSLAHIHTQSQSLQERRHRKHRDPGAVLTHQARGACGNSPDSQVSSVTGTSTQ